MPSVELGSIPPLFSFRVVTRLAFVREEWAGILLKKLVLRGCLSGQERNAQKGQKCGFERHAFDEAWLT